MEDITAHPQGIHSEPKDIPDMTDREIAEETLYWLRQAGQALSQIQSSGMGAMLGKMMGSGK